MQKRALLVGILYKNTRNELHGCVNDVENVKKLLISVYGYQEENIVLLTDDTQFKPTAENIIAGWQWLLSKSPAVDFPHLTEPIQEGERVEFFFHYSGHGSQVPDRNGDEPDGEDETICPLDFATAGMITDDTIRERLALQVPPNCRLIAVIDACHSATSFDLMWNCKSVGSSFSLEKVNDYTPTPGEVIVFSGCRDNQTSADAYIDNKPQGALTYAFCHCLEQANYQISYEALLANIRSCLSKDKISKQVPCYHSVKQLNLPKSSDYKN